jgi:hypothetical protein
MQFTRQKDKIKKNSHKLPKLQFTSFWFQGILEINNKKRKKHENEVLVYNATHV